MSREPVVTRATAVAVVGLAAALLGRFGVVVPPEIGGHLVEVVAVAAPLAVAWLARRHVTPVADPRDASGRPLTPAPVADVPPEPATTPPDTTQASPA